MKELYEELRQENNQEPILKEDNKKIGKARSVNSTLEFFTKDFIYPVDKYIITGWVYSNV